MSEYVHQISESEHTNISKFVYIMLGGTAGFAALVAILFLTAHQWMSLISHEKERQFVEPYVDLTENHVLTEGDPELQAYVTRLSERLASHMDLDPGLELNVVVIEGDVTNAFTTLGGYIFVYEGLIRSLDNENSLAMVIAHEIAHAKNRDPLFGMGRGVLIQVALTSFTNGRVGGGGISAAPELMLHTYTRDQEEAADILAIAALEEAYGHVGGATALFKELEEQGGDVPEDLEFLSSHPNLERRIKYLNAETKKKGWKRLAPSPYPEKVAACL